MPMKIATRTTVLSQMLVFRSNGDAKTVALHLTRLTMWGYHRVCSTMMGSWTSLPQGLPSCSTLTWHFTLIFRLMLRVRVRATSQLARQLLLQLLLRLLLQATRCGCLPLQRCSQKCWPMDLQSFLILRMLESPIFLYSYILYPISYIPKHIYLLVLNNIFC